MTYISTRANRLGLRRLGGALVFSSMHIPYLTLPRAAAPIGKRVTLRRRGTVSVSVTIPITTAMVHDV